MQKFLFYNKLTVWLYMFRALCAHHQKVEIVLYSIWYHHTCRWPSAAPYFSTGFRKALWCQMSWKSGRWELSCSVRADWRTERLGEAIFAFHNFEKTPKMYNWRKMSWAIVGVFEEFSQMRESLDSWNLKMNESHALPKRQVKFTKRNCVTSQKTSNFN